MLEVKFALEWDYNGRRGKETFFHTAIGSFVTSMRDWSPAFRAMVKDVLRPGVEEQFTTYGHGEWAPLMPETIRRKGHDTILFNTGRLYRSFQGGSDYVEEIGRANLRWGSLVPYALFHQTGTGVGFQQLLKTAAGPGVPMRKILDLTDPQKRKMRSLLVVQLANLARKEGFGLLQGQTGVSAGLARLAGMRAFGL